MNTKRMAILVLAVGLLLGCRPIYAHHSVAMFDMEQVTTVKGTVTDFEWTNPHSYVYLDVKDDKGNVEKWTFETAGPLLLSRTGWNRGILKPGDKITISGNPSRDGKKLLHLVKVVLPNGREMNGGEPPTAAK